VLAAHERLQANYIMPTRDCFESGQAGSEKFCPITNEFGHRLEANPALQPVPLYWSAFYLPDSPTLRLKSSKLASKTEPSEAATENRKQKYHAVIEISKIPAESEYQQKTESQTKYQQKTERQTTYQQKTESQQNTNRELKGKQHTNRKLKANKILAEN